MLEQECKKSYPIKHIDVRYHVIAKSFEITFMGNGNGFLIIIVMSLAAIAATIASRVN